VNDPKVSLDWVRYMNMVDLVELIIPIGLQKNNAVDIMESFWELHCHCLHSFLWTLESTIEPNGV